MDEEPSIFVASLKYAFWKFSKINLGREIATSKNQMKIFKIADLVYEFLKAPPISQAIFHFSVSNLMSDRVD